MLEDLFDGADWQMSRGERAAVRGVLASLAPELAVEIGSADGAGLRELADRSREVHSFDLTPPRIAQPDHVTLHTGDSHVLLGQFLAELAAADRNVDFVMVDGDHTPEGVRRDVEDLLDSPAVSRTVILIHDTANERVRAGLDAISFGAWPKVAHVELDWVSGYLFAEPALRNELWYGLGLVVVDAAAAAVGTTDIYERRFHPAGPLLAEIQRLVSAREHDPPLVLDAHREADRLRLRVGELLAENGQLHGRRQAELAAAAAEAGRTEHELRTRIWELETAAWEADRRIWELENSGTGESDALRAELEDSRDAARRAQAALTAVTTSKLWRLSAPLRRVRHRTALRGR